MVSVRKLRLVALLAVAGLLGGCLSARIDESTVEQANTTPPRQTIAGALPAVPVVGSTDYRVGPMDILDIQVFGVPDLSKPARVSEDGEISVPLIGRVPVNGKTTSELERDLAARWSAGYLENPQVTVFVKEYMSQRVTVEGAVRKPGIYSLTSRTSLLQIIALSNGLDELANPRGIVIYRNIGDKRYAAAFDIREIRAGRLVDPEVLGNDIVVIDYSGPRSNLKDFVYTVPLLAMFMVL